MPELLAPKTSAPPASEKFWLSFYCIRSAAAKQGKRVLLVDDADYYGSQWSSFWLEDSTIALGGAPLPTNPQLQPLPRPSAPSALPHDCIEVPLATTSARAIGVTRHAAPQGAASSTANRSTRHQVILDRAPRVLYQCEPLVDALIACGGQHYVEFKLVEGNFIFQNGRLRLVPASKSEIFRDKTLGLAEKRALMKFLAECLAAVDGGGPLADAFDASPLSVLLQRQGLSAALQVTGSMRDRMRGYVMGC